MEQCPSTVDAIRDMHPGDIESVLAIEQDSYATPWTAVLFLEELSSSFCCDRVALHHDGVIGYSCFALVADEAHLRNLAVAETFRCRGVASALLADMIRIASGRGATLATLEVRPSNTGAVELYGRFGFQVTAVRPRYYEDSREDALIMWADLGKLRWI